MRNFAIAILSLIAIALPQSAIAQVYNSPHKWTDSFGKIRVYIPGTADTVVDIITEISKEYTFTKSVCGWISLRESSTRKIKSFSSPLLSSIVDFSVVNVTYLHSPLCEWSTTGWTWGEVPDQPYPAQQPIQTLWKVTGTNQFLIKISIPFVYPLGIQGTVVYENTIKSKINACGFGTIIVSPTRPMTTFKINSVDYTLATLPSVTKPQICRIQSGVKVRYLPLVP